MMKNWNRGLRKGLVLVCILTAFGTGCSTSKQASKVDEGVTKAPPSSDAAASGERDVRRETVVAPSSSSTGTKETLVASALPGSQPVTAAATATGDLKSLERNLKDIYFEFDKYDLTEEARNILSQNAKLLLANPRAKLIIEGHCDERGTIEYNLALGEKRANSARDYLVNLGIQGSRLQTVSYGEEKPIDRGHAEESWAKNRRAHLVVTE